jgi:hypothetical protein
MTTPADDARAERKEEWDLLHKAATTLMVANAAGLVACLTLLKDYDSTPQLKGVGTFIWVFGIGLLAAICAMFGVMAIRPLWLRGRPPERYGWYIGPLAVTVGASGACVAIAVIFAIEKFGKL